ncbi:SnoaL-like domain-containing protein [Chitinophaga niabensis]|uniref:SnoaL-like domain-containing protein n=1 Tax=Chitinophaga niabensis TaxID=536979 RepID=A0A1N6IZV5_9BACT|nr:SnoaL-like domain-containing protein [Chitinophaga niabensis]SIO37614.1 hypothetical protein SAMN04488055_3505 [Chitinophaga niabensis]
MKETITQEIAYKLISFCKKSDWQGAYDQLFSEDARSIESFKSPIAEIETIGLQAIRDKAKRFDELIEKVHEIKVSEPLIMNNHFSFSLTMDGEMTGKGYTVILSEICIYEVQKGKIVYEQFFYTQN